MRKIKTCCLLSVLALVGCSENSDPENPNPEKIEASYSVGGIVSGLNGDSIIIQNNGADDTTITENGEYTLLAAYSDQSSYEISISKQPEDPNQNCSISGNSGTIDNADVVTVDIDCINIYPVSGQLYDLFNRSPIVISNNGTDIMELTADGLFEFINELEDGSTYNVVQTDDPQSVDCAIINGTGTISGGAVTDIKIYCNGVPVSDLLEDRKVSFVTLIYQPILRQYCITCHERGGNGVGQFADLDIDIAYHDAVRLINVPDGESILVTKVQSGHFCWPLTGIPDCPSSTDELNTAISTWISENYQ